MTIALYMDVHVHRAITTGLRLRDVDVLTAQEDGYRTADDDRLLDRATQLQRVLFTQDDDLLAEARLRQVKGIPFAGVIYAHQLRITIGRCIQDLELIAKASEPDEMANRVEYLPL
jgi:predicted nuclease of predicted toxin-antitoxin system